MEFVFVNKNKSSGVLTRAEGREKAQVQSHAQTQRRQREKRSERSEPWRKHATLLVVGEPQASTRKRRASPPAQDALAESSSLIRCPTRNSSDPFNCTIVGSDVGNHAILQFVAGQAPKLTFLAEAFAPRAATSKKPPLPMRHDRAVAIRLKSCVEDKALMYSTLAYGSSLLAWMAGVVDTSRPPEYFIGRALQEVRLRLSGPPQSQSDPGLALSIYALAITELWNQIPPIWVRCRDRYVAGLDVQELRGTASRSHLKALLSLVEGAGGWKSFDPYILESAILADKYLAITEWSKPVVPLTWAPSALRSAPWANVEISNPSLGRKLIESSICDELKVIIGDIVYYIHVAQSAWSCGDMPHSFQSQLFWHLQHLEYRLLTLDDLAAVDDCVRIAALSFLLNITQYHGSQVCAGILIPRLRAALARAQFWKDDFDAGIRFWCFCTGALTTEASSDKEWCIGMLGVLSGDGAPFTATVVRDKLAQYLFLPDRQEAQLASLIKTSSLRC